MSWSDSITETQHLQTRIAYTGSNGSSLVDIKLRDDFQVEIFEKIEHLEQYLDRLTLFTTPEIVMMEIDNDNTAAVFSLVKKIKETPLTCGLIIVLIAVFHTPKNKERAIELKVHDYYRYPFDPEELNERLKFLIKFKLIKSDIQNLVYNVRKKYKIPVSKRIFDIILSSCTIIVLLPLFSIVALLIRLESKGPIIYKSKRAGTGYKIFNFYKFRSMHCNAETQLQELASTLNQYSIDGSEQGTSAFVKLKNDPRITRIGKVLRKTSIDELPQLINVLKGDMSIVGNRPLPLYEAELLTSNEWCIRFLGPAGITGLWQITKRGRSEMSDTERRKLDNYYVDHSSLFFDLRIIVLTIPALFQKENV